MDSNHNSLVVAKNHLLDSNTFKWWLLLAVMAYLTSRMGWWALLLPVVVLLVEDVLITFGHRFLFNPQLRIQRNYQWCHNMFTGATGQGRDLAFNLVKDDGSLSLVEKYRHLANFLRLKRGMKIIDLGCGYGDWLRYCRDELGCDVVGVNISPEQAEYARSTYGLEVLRASWEDILTDENLQKRLYGQFDAVTAMDTMEHWVNMEYRHDAAKQKEIYRNACLLMAKLFNPSRDRGRAFISLLHQVRRKRTLGFYVCSYFLDKFYSGHYPFEDEGPLVECRPWFDIKKVEDRTEDYRLSGVKDPLNFQATRYAWTPRQIAYVIGHFFLDPYVLHRLGCYLHDSWMKLYGNDPYSETYDLETRLKTTWVRLLWIAMERRPEAEVSR